MTNYHSLIFILSRKIIAPYLESGACIYNLRSYWCHIMSYKVNLLPFLSFVELTYDNMLEVQVYIFELLIDEDVRTNNN